jgi:transposase InsO family protein
LGPPQWAADIIYIPMHRGFMYLVAIMDWHSRKVLSWKYGGPQKLDNVLSSESPTMKEVNHEQQKKTVLP